MPPNLLAAVEEEIREEKATTVTRTARRLEELLAELVRLEARAVEAGAFERAVLVREHAELRADARKYLWYLLIEREAMGLTDHHIVEELYRVPSPLR
ncbi:MAG: hypothetical protein ACK4N5_25250 [Myxococcales bacterium]